MSDLKEKMKYYEMLAKKYPTPQSLYTEIINLQAILNLPKGTEHFMSDLHGESKAFEHILNKSEKKCGCISAVICQMNRLMSFAR